MEAGPVKRRGCLYNRPHMRRLMAVALLSYAASIPAALAADSSLLGLAPAGSDVLAGINFKRILESDFGKMLSAQMTASANPEFKAYVEKAGFDPLRDLDEVLIAAPAKQKPSAFLMLRGNFDAAKLAQLAAAGGMKGSDYHGVQILVKPGPQEGLSAVAVMDAHLIVGGDEAAVRAFVDRRGGGPGLSAAIAARASEASKANDIWVVMHAAPAAFAPPSATAGPMGELVQSIEQASLGIKFGAEIVISLQAVTHTPKDAEGLAAAVRLFSGMAAAGQKNNPQAAAMLQRLKVDSEGSTARLSLAIPEVEAEAAIHAAMAAGAKGKEAASARTSPGDSSPKDSGGVTFNEAAPASGPQPSGTPSQDTGVVTLPAPKR